MVHIFIGDEEVQVYYSKKLIALHKISKNKVNYKENHHLRMIEKTFGYKENIEKIAKEHLKQLESFNEQLSGIT